MFVEIAFDDSILFIKEKFGIHHYTVFTDSTV